MFGLSAMNQARGQPSSLSFAEVDSLSATEARPVVVFLHADWCRYCQGMKQTTLKDRQVQAYLRDEAYFVSFDGEQQETVQFRGATFQFQATGNGNGTHELAYALGTIEGKLSYPVIAVINPENEIVFQYSGFLTARQLLKVLRRL